MGYRDLYDFCQNLPTPISRNTIRAEITRLLPDQPHSFIMEQLDLEKARGYYVSPNNVDHQFVRQTGGGAVIVLGRGLNRCWQRFVAVKEMMHLFDEPLEATNSPADLESLLLNFEAPNSVDSPQMRSEVTCFWRAVGLLCPEVQRASLQQDVTNGTKSHLDVATILRVPELYIPAFFHRSYKSIIASLD